MSPRQSKCKSRAELAKLALAIMPRCSFDSAKLQIKIERTKKKGEKLASCSQITIYNN